MPKRSITDRAPGATRPAPRAGGLGAVAGAPGTGRRAGATCRAAPGAADVGRRMRLTLDKAQQKLLASRQSLQTSVAAMRAELASPAAFSAAGIQRDG
jgi:hypothetical protein